MSGSEQGPVSPTQEAVTVVQENALKQSCTAPLTGTFLLTLFPCIEPTCPSVPIRKPFSLKPFQGPVSQWWSDPADAEPPIPLHTNEPRRDPPSLLCLSPEME